MLKRIFRAQGWMWWLTPVILATWEVELTRITVWGQPRQKVHKTPSQKMVGSCGMHLSSCQKTWKGLQSRSVQIFLRPYLKNNQCSQVPVAQAWNPSYSGGRDQEDHDLKPAHAKSLWELISKKPITIKRGWWDGSRCRPWVQALVPHTWKKIANSKKVWWGGSSDRAPAEQALDSEFNPPVLPKQYNNT
jgi:hypothetical protein